MILWMKHQRDLKSLNVVMTVFLSSISNKIYYIVIFKNPRDNSQFATIARQIRPDKVKFLMWAYKDSASSLHTYLMLDFTPDTEERYRVRSNILEDPQDVYTTH